MPFSLQERAFICAIAANAAYFKGAEAKVELHSGQQLCQFNSITDYDDSVTDSQAFIASNDEVVLVAFRGTEATRQDILTDARTRLAVNDNGEGLVHTGFQTALRGFEATTLFADLEAAMKNGGKRQLWLTGHSLGGALVTLAAQLCEKNGLEVHALCTFGTPMVGDRFFTEAFEKQFLVKYQRYVYRSDIFPRLPSSQSYLLSMGSLVTQMPIGAYQQVGSEYHIDQANNITVLTAGCAASAINTILPIPLSSFTDHHIINYIQVLRLSLNAVPNKSILVTQASQGSLQEVEINDLSASLLSAKSASKCCCVVS